jgi:hypothetical protein
MIMKTRFFQSIDQFFFKAENNLNLAFFRIGTALAAIAILIAQYPDLLEIYGQYGYLRADIVELPLLSFQPRLSWMTDFLAGFGFSEFSSLKVVFWAYLSFLLLLGIGILPSLTALICLFFQVSFMNSGQYYIYGVDYFILAALFYCILFPVGQQLAVNLFNQKRKKQSWVFYTRVLQIHVCLVYFISGFDKGLGYDWWNGEAIWTTMMGLNFRSVDVSFMAEYPLIPTILGWSVLLIEFGYPFFIYWKKTRYLWLTMTILMHVGIGVFLGLYYFASVMIIFNVAAFGGEWLRSVFVGRRKSGLEGDLISGKSLSVVS